MQCIADRDSGVYGNYGRYVGNGYGGGYSNAAGAGVGYLDLRYFLLCLLFVVLLYCSNSFSLCGILSGARSVDYPTYDSLTFLHRVSAPNLLTSPEDFNATFVRAFSNIDLMIRYFSPSWHSYRRHLFLSRALALLAPIARACLSALERAPRPL